MRRPRPVVATAALVAVLASACAAPVHQQPWDSGRSSDSATISTDSNLTTEGTQR
jgi:hypothetical protein